MDDDLKAAVERVEGFCGATENGGVAEWGLYDPVPDLRALLSALRQRDEALEFIAEGRDVGRHDGLPEECPAHDADTMFAVARAILTESETNAR